MRDITVRVKLSELTAMQAEIKRLRERLSEYEPAMKNILLGDIKSVHPLRKDGPRSILENFPDKFTAEWAMAHGANKDMLRMWRNRGYIVTDEMREVYTRTDAYKAKLWLGKLTRASTYNS